jgi:hypothetical protein
MRGGITKEQDAQGRVRWRIRWYAADGRRRSESYRTLKQAERELRKRLDESEAGSLVVDRHRTLNDFLPEWQRAKQPNVKTRTWDSYAAHVALYVKPRLGGVRLAHVNAQAVQRFVDDLGLEGLSAKSVQNVHATLNLILVMAARYGYCQPPGRVELPRVRRAELAIPTPLEVEALAEAIDPRLSALVVLCGYAGLRQGGRAWPYAPRTWIGFVGASTWAEASTSRRGGGRRRSRAAAAG